MNSTFAAGEVDWAAPGDPELADAVWTAITAEVLIRSSVHFGTSSQIGGNGWATWQYWTSGSTGPNGTMHNCTTYAAYRLQQNGYPYPRWTGDARDWAAKAQSHDVTVNQTPAVGSIAQWNGNHVAYVEAVTASYIITTSDSSQAPGKPAYGTDRLEIARNSPYTPDNFIHFKDLKATLPAQPGGLSATSPTTPSLILHWSESAIDVTDFVTHYRIANGAWHACRPLQAALA